MLEQEIPIFGHPESPEGHNENSLMSNEVASQTTSLREWIRLGLLFGSPLFCAASNIGIALLAFSLSPTNWNNSAAGAIFLVNSALAIVGCGTGGFLSGDSLIERVVLMLFGVIGGVLLYLAFNCFGFSAVFAVAIAIDLQ